MKTIMQRNLNDLEKIGDIQQHILDTKEKFAKEQPHFTEVIQTIIKNKRLTRDQLLAQLGLSVFFMYDLLRITNNNSVISKSLIMREIQHLDNPVAIERWFYQYEIEQPYLLEALQRLFAEIFCMPKDMIEAAMWMYITQVYCFLTSSD